MKKLPIPTSLFLLFIFHTTLSAQTGFEDRFNLSGFAEVKYSRYEFVGTKDMPTTKLMFPENDHFVLNHLNLYMTFNIDDDWLFLSEIAYLFAPTGKMESELDEANMTNTETYIDNTFMNEDAKTVRYGSISIERGYIEWNSIQYAKIRMGRYLTPYGIWGQDHGAPIVTTINLPLLAYLNTPKQIGMPTAQTGMELLGTVNIPVADILVDYIAYIGNGTSEIEANNDSDSNKAVGGFLNFTFPTIADNIDLKFGGSFYRGTRSQLHERKSNILFIQNTENNQIGATVDYYVSDDKYLYWQMDTFGGAHLNLSISSLPFDGTLIIQTEVLRQWIKETKENQLVTRLGYPRSADEYKADFFYVQGQYELFGFITPYFRYDYFTCDSLDPEISLIIKKIQMYTVGINIKPVPRVVLKFEGAFADFEMDEKVVIYPSGEKVTENNDLYLYQASISVAF